MNSRHKLFVCQMITFSLHSQIFRHVSSVWMFFFFLKFFFVISFDKESEFLFWILLPVGQQMELKIFPRNEDSFDLKFTELIITEFCYLFDFKALEKSSNHTHNGLWQIFFANEFVFHLSFLDKWRVNFFWQTVRKPCSHYVCKSYRTIFAPNSPHCNFWTNGEKICHNYVCQSFRTIFLDQTLPYCKLFLDKQWENCAHHYVCQSFRTILDQALPHCKFFRDKRKTSCSSLCLTKF